MAAVVKSLKYIQAGGKGAGRAKAHVRYIQHRPGEDREQSDGLNGGRELFDDERDDVDRGEINELIENQKDGVALHKMVLSPGVPGVNMKDYTRKMMSEFCQSKGQNLRWVATIHRNTDHDHAHVAILGRDKDKHRVSIYPNDLKFLRHKGDRYLEREHGVDRELEKEAKLARAMVEKTHATKGNHKLDRLLGSQGWKNEPPKKIEKPQAGREQAVDTLPDKDKIVVQGKVYSRYSTTAELKELDKHLKANKSDRIERTQYSLMNQWMDAKARHGDDCYTKWDSRRSREKQQKSTGKWTKEQAMNSLGDGETITVRDKTYTKFSQSKELIRLDSYLVSHYEERIDKQQYAMLHGWINDKRKHGEDFHEKQAQEHFARTGSYDFKPLDKASKRAYDDRKGFVSRYLTNEQYEHQGKTLDFHTIYANNMAKQRLIEAGNRNPELKHVYEKDLQDLRQHSQEAFAGMEKVDLDKLFGANERAREEKSWDYKFDLHNDVEDIIDLREINIDSGLKQVQPDQDPFALKESQSAEESNVVPENETTEETTEDNLNKEPDAAQRKNDGERSKDTLDKKQSEHEVALEENEVNVAEDKVESTEREQDKHFDEVKDIDPRTKSEMHLGDVIASLEEQKEQRIKIRDAKLSHKENDEERDDEHER